MATLEEWHDAARRAVPPLTGEVRLPGLSAPVLLLRDGFGVPHLRAATAPSSPKATRTHRTGCSRWS